MDGIGNTLADNPDPVRGFLYMLFWLVIGGVAYYGLYQYLAHKRKVREAQEQYAERRAASRANARPILAGAATGATSAPVTTMPPPRTTMPPAPVVEKPAQAAPAAPEAPKTTTPSAQGESLMTWLEMTKQRPHLAIIGESGAGKSTFTSALLMLRPGKVFIVGLKPDDRWCGVPFVTIDDDTTFTGMTKAAEEISAEIKRRWSEVKKAKNNNTTAQFEPLTIVLDDYPDQKDQIGVLADTVLFAARMGRSMRVNLILLAQGSGVKSFGFEGYGDARDNFLFVNLGTDHWKNGNASIWKWGTKESDKTRIDTREMEQYAKQSISASRWFMPDRFEIRGAFLEPKPTQDDLTLTPEEAAELSAVRVSKVSAPKQVIFTPKPVQTVTTPEPVPEPVPEPAPKIGDSVVSLPEAQNSTSVSGTGSGTSATGTGSEGDIGDTVAVEPLIRRMLSQGATRNQIATFLGGNRKRMLERIRVIAEAQTAYTPESKPTPTA